MKKNNISVQIIYNYIIVLAGSSQPWNSTCRFGTPAVREYFESLGLDISDPRCGKGVFGPFMGKILRLLYKDTNFGGYVCKHIYIYMNLWYLYMCFFWRCMGLIHLFIHHLFILVSCTFEFTFYEYAITLVDRICNWSIWCSRKMKLQQEIVPHSIYSSMAIVWVVWSLYRSFSCLDMLASSCISIVPDWARPEHDLLYYVMGHSGLAQNHRIPTAVHR